MIKGLTTCFILITSLSLKTIGQDKNQTWQEQLKPCEVEVPLYYSTKNQPKLVETAEQLKGVELTLLTIDKKKDPSYKTYYLERYQSSYGPSAYLVKSEFLNMDRRPEHVIFLSYNPKKHTFYKADCFRDNPGSKDIKQGE
jgi:hypothetical protein